MTSDFTIEVTDVTGGTDYRWLRSSHGTDAGVTGTLDLTGAKGIAALRDADTGIVPSGVAVGQITASGFYGIHDTTANDGREILAGFVLTDTSITNTKGVVQPSNKAPFALIKHGIISRKFLPVVAQRTSITYLTANTGQFVYVD